MAVRVMARFLIIAVALDRKAAAASRVLLSFALRNDRNRLLESNLLGEDVYRAALTIPSHLTSIVRSLAAVLDLVASTG